MNNNAKNIKNGNANRNKNNGINAPPIREYSPLEKVGILDPKHLRENPFTQKPYDNAVMPNAKNGLYFWEKLPMYSGIEDKIKTFEKNQVILLTSSTGSGKSVLGPFIA